MRPPIALTIAGSDSGGGAGIQADLKTFHALGVYGTSAITAVTSQNTLGVRGVHPVPAPVLLSQAEAVLDDFPVDATKIGMLGEASVAEALAELLDRRRAQCGTLVLDPVMVATSGDPLLSTAAEATLRDRLLSHADLITPNLPEAARLLGAEPARTVEEMQEQARALLAHGPRAVLVKGGHLIQQPDMQEAVDLLVLKTPGGVQEHRLTAPLVRTRSTHGTGCTLSSAVAAHAARHASPEALTAEELAAEELVQAVRSGKEFLTQALRDAVPWQISRRPEQGHGPVNHLSQSLR